MASAKDKLQLSEQLGELIPVDPETCGEMVEYGLNLDNDNELYDHYLNLLGESEGTETFLKTMMNVRSQKKTKKKNIIEPERAALTQKAGNPWKTGGNNKETQEKTSNSAPKPTKSTPKTTSDLLKQPQQHQKSTKKSRRRNLDNLKDLESVLNALEVSDTKDNDKITRCRCNATRHPLFEIAPNCLNCGKIICAKEGLQPCSFCGQELLSQKERAEIRLILSQEMTELQQKQVKPAEPETPKPSGKAKKIVVSMNPGENLWNAQDKALKQAQLEKKQQQEALQAEKEHQEMQHQQEQQLKYYEETQGVNQEFLEAQDRLNRLLEYQESGAERTKIIDTAADYEMPNSSGNMWLSATERALALKKQQRQWRKYDEEEKVRSGRGERRVEMVIKDGKVKMVEKYGPAPEESEDGGNDKGKDDISELEDKLKSDKSNMEEALTKNVWDYEGDSKRWEKPVYKPKQRLQEDDIKRVQAEKENGEELIVSMY